jgi:hypothetical protein
MIDEVPSALVASRFERACGVPSTIQCGGIGAGMSSSLAGAAKTMAFDMSSLPKDGQLNGASTKKV